MSKTSKELKEIKKYLKNKIKKVNEKLDEIEIANAISEYLDVEELRKNLYCSSWVPASFVDLHSHKAFNKLLKVLSEESYLCGYNNGGNEYYHCHYTSYILMLDEKTAVEIQLTEKTKRETQTPKAPELMIRAYIGDNTLSIKAKDGVCEGRSRVSIMDSDFDVFDFNIDGDYSSLDGKDVVDVIETVDLANLVKKDGKDYHIQKIKK